ncbi:hypothetical protein, partial [Pseudomonas proteolytica]
GCEAALNPAIAVYLKKRGGLFGAASQPSAGQARSPRGSSSVSESCVDTYGYRRQACSRIDSNPVQKQRHPLNRGFP